MLFTAYQLQHEHDAGMLLAELQLSFTHLFAIGLPEWIRLFNLGTFRGAFIKLLKLSGLFYLAYFSRFILSNCQSHFGITSEKYC